MVTKRILGLDLGTTSIGWALVDEAQNKNEKSTIVKTGVRLVPLTVDEDTNFSKGKSITTNSDRTLKRGARRSLQRYKMRREHLTNVLLKNKIIDTEFILAEVGKDSTFDLWKIRSRAATEKLTLGEFARVLFSINKKRGYKSNRKAKDENDGSAIDGMEIAKDLIRRNITPGQLSLEFLEGGKKKLPDFYRSDLHKEFNKIWEFQSQFYQNILTDILLAELDGLNTGQTWKVCEEPFEIKGTKLEGNKKEIELKKYLLRANGLSEKLELEHLAIVLLEINGQINSSSSYLGAISDRSKELIIKEQTIGQYLYWKLQNNQHSKLKNQVFYRQDYLDEFNQIWDLQAQFHSELNEELKAEIRDVIIFYQRRLKSQKGLIGYCEFESREIELKDKKGELVLRGDGKPKKIAIGPKVCPKSSPIFQDFKIWQLINNLEFRNLVTREKVKIQDIDEDLAIRHELYEELSIHGSRTTIQILNIVYSNLKDWELNYKEGLDGNKTVESLFKAFQKIGEETGHTINFKEKAAKIKSNCKELFEFLKLNSNVLNFDKVSESEDYQKTASFRLWHLLYSYEGDNSVSGNEALIEKLHEKFGFTKEHSKILSEVVFKEDYGSLSTKAMLKILPHLKDGLRYDDACLKAGYNHSHFITADENEKRELKNALELLPKNSLRNPVVEKILNQLVNVVNALIKEYGRPDEIRIELARDLKKSAKERETATKGINAATKRHEKIKETLKGVYPFSTGVRITKNDIIKYKLWQELEDRGHKTIYTNAYVPLEKLFSKEFDIEHIIPKARVFDDSFSNKTLATRQFNLDKADETAIDFMNTKFGENSKEVADYISNVEGLYSKNRITKAKYNKLLTPKDKIKDGFIERDLRNTQYIAKKARQMLLEVTRFVTPTTGSITDKLRNDWQLVEVMKELNLPKYEALDMIYFETNKDGKKIKLIKDWTKRNDHRHHAMDAIAIAFCKHSHVQYFNYLNARKDENNKHHGNIIAISKKETSHNEKGRRVVNPPMPLNEFRLEAKKYLEQTLISFKAKNKVVTRNKNKTKKKVGYQTQKAITPRGKLHKETIYGRSIHLSKKEEKVSGKFDEEKINTVSKKVYRQALLERLKEFDSNPKKAFTGKNTLEKTPIIIDKTTDEILPEMVEVNHFEEIFTIRKDINPDNFKTSKNIDKVVDLEVRKILMNRLQENGNDSKKAFSNLEKEPIWLNQEKGISIKRVTITGVSNAEALHVKKDHFGNNILDKNGKAIPADYVNTGNNHHVAIYKDEKGNLQEKVVSFYEAVARANEGLSVIDKIFNSEIGWQFLFTMKQNEMFIFPNETSGFNPSETDLKDEKNYAKISPNLFRVQKISTKNYVFNHHLESLAVNGDTLKNKALSRNTYCLVQTPVHLNGLVKVRIKHLGKIIHVGEY